MKYGVRRKPDRGARRVGKTTLLTNFPVHDGQEIHLIEERNGKHHAYEIKWSSRKTPKIPTAWQKAYPIASLQQFTGENYLSLILEGVRGRLEM